jgi:hypothetical protein
MLEFSSKSACLSFVARDISIFLLIYFKIIYNNYMRSAGRGSRAVLGRNVFDRSETAIAVLNPALGMDV